MSEPGDRAGGRPGTEDPRPVAAYATLAAMYSTVLGALLGWCARRGRLPRRIPLADVLLLGLATRQVARVLTRDKVAAWVRAPFTSYDPKGGGEAEEVPRGDGLRRAVGELVLCPYCVGMWVAGVFTAGLLLVPRATRAVAAVLTMYGVSAAIPELLLLRRRAERS